MADRYWVGGSGTWNTTSTTNWSTQSGGSGGASVPTAADSVFFDQASTYTVSMTGALTCLDITVSAGTVTFALGASPTLAISGSMSLSASTVWNSPGTITFNSTSSGRTITTNGVTIAASVTLNGVGGVWTFGSALNLGATNTLTLTNGTLNASTYNVTVGLFSSTNSNVRTLSMGSGLWTITGTGTVWNASTFTSFTLNANTANILLSNNTTTARTFSGGSLIYNKLTIGGDTSTSTTTLAGSSYYSELATTKTVAHTVALGGGTTQSVLTWSITGTIGNVVTLSAASTATIVTPNRPSTLNYINATNINAQQAPFYLGTGSTVTTCTNVFASAYIAPFTHYWVDGSGVWNDGLHWSTSPGGSAGSANPFGDEDVVFDSASNATGYTVNITLAALTMVCKNLTLNAPASGNLALAPSSSSGANSNISIFGSISVAATNITIIPNIAYIPGFTFRSIVTGNTLNFGALSGNVRAALDFVGLNGEWTFTNNFINQNIAGTAYVSHTSGTLNTAGYTIVPGLTFASTGNVPRTLNFGSSKVSVGAGSASYTFTLSGTNLTFNPGTSTVCAFSINGGGRNFYAISNDGGTLNSFGATDTFSYLVGIAPGTINIGRAISILGFQTQNTAGNRRVLFTSPTLGITYTVTVTGTSTITDADFRDICVIGTSAPISGTRIGNLGGCSGITFSTPKTVYWVTTGGGNWSGDNWAATSGGTANTDNFPLVQDIAVIENTGLNTSATVTLDAAIPYVGSVNMSTRTNAMSIIFGVADFPVYGDWTNGSGTSVGWSSNIWATVFAKRSGTQTVTSAGKGWQRVTVNSFDGTVKLADALFIGFIFGIGFTLTSGTIDLNGQTLTGSGSSNPGTVVIGAITSHNTIFVSGTLRSNFIFNGGTLICPASGAAPFQDVSNGLCTFSAGLGGNGTIRLTSQFGPLFSSTGNNYPCTLDFQTGGAGISGNNTFANITISAPAAGVYKGFYLSGNQTVTGTLTCAGGSAVGRVLLNSNVLGTTRTLTVGTLAATDCDFRDITIAGAAAGSSPTRAGNLGGNSGITFPSPKTVYWNLAGTRNWEATAWALSSGGIPDVNNFPLAQDTAVFDDVGSAGTVTTGGWNIGNIDMSARTTAMTLTSGAPTVIGDWKWGTGVTSTSNANAITFAKRGTQTITSNGVTFGCPVTVNGVTGSTIVQLADALTLDAARTLTLTAGEFDAVTYNVTTGLFSATAGTFKMGSGDWALSGTGTVWSNAPTNFYKGSANITLSDTSSTARTFAGGNLSYNKLTIGGATGTSTLTITGNNQFTELASTKTVAHTIALGTTTQTFGKWSVTGTLGNVVTLTGTGTNHVLAGAATSGIDYLAMGSIGFSVNSPGEFYAGANSTGTAAAPVYRTATPAATTRYWVGGTGNWSDTNRWSTGSGGSSGASVPTSLDDVVFDAASNATAYTATVDAISRCNKLTIAGPTSGNVTLAGTAVLIMHDDVTLPATGLTFSYTGPSTLSGSTSGKVLTTNGVTWSSISTINGVGSEWALGSALATGNRSFNISNGLFDCDTYNLTVAGVVCNTGNSNTIDFGSGTHSLSGSAPINFGTTETNAANLTVTAGTAQLNCSTTSPDFSGNGKTFYNVAFTSTNAGTVTINGANSFNNLSFTGITSAGLKNISVTANQTVTGTFTCSAGTDATMRHFVRSDTLGTTRTLTCAAVSLTDVDFRDITIAGAAAPATGTRIGDCKGNSGITFTAAANKYWNLAAGGNWSGTGWATSSGDTPAANNFPLAQDTCFFEATGLNSGATITVNQSYNIGTIDMSARTTNTMTLATGSTTPTIYGNWINGTGTTLTGTGRITFAGRGSQTLTSAGKTVTQPITVDSPSGSVTLQDALTLSEASSTVLTLTSGTFDAVSYNVSLSGSTGGFSSSSSNTRTLAIGSGTWTVAGSGSSWNINSSGLNITGTGTISFTSASAKTFNAGTVSYSGVTLNQGGAGALTVGGNNTFKTITNTYSATGATTINFGTTTTRITDPWLAKGEPGRVLTITGTSASSPCTLVYTGTGEAANVDYLNITGVRAFKL